MSKEEQPLKKRRTLIPGVITLKSKEGTLTDFHKHDLITNSDYFKTLLENTDDVTIKVNEEEKYIDKLFIYFKDNKLSFTNTKEIVDMWILGHKWMIDGIADYCFSQYNNLINNENKNIEEDLKLLPQTLVFKSNLIYYKTFTKNFLKLNNRAHYLNSINNIQLIRHILRILCINTDITDFDKPLKKIRNKKDHSWGSSDFQF